MALAVPPDEFLGFEPDLIRELGVSRPTFRQAARLVENEQVIAINRGTKGGFYSRRPDIAAVVQSAAVYLRAHGATMSDLLAAMNPLSIELAKMAAESRDEEIRARLRASLEELEEVETTPQSVHDFHVTEGEVMDLLYEMAANRPLELIVRALYRFGNTAFTSIFDGREDLMQIRRSSRIRLIRAILAGDGEIAMLIAKRNTVEMGSQFAALIDEPMGKKRPFSRIAPES